MATWFFDLADDVRLAFRSLRKQPMFSIGVILIMMVGIGTNVAIFTYYAYVHFSTIPAPNPERVVWIRSLDQGKGDLRLSIDDFRRLESSDLGTRQLAGSRLLTASLQTTDRNLFQFGWAVSGRYFELFGARPHLGRLLYSSDDSAGAEPVLVLSHPVWQKYFASDPSVVGTTLKLNTKHPVTIVGVAPRGFQGTGLGAGFYMPLQQAHSIIPNLRDVSISTLGRLERGVSIEQLRDRLQRWSQGLDQELPLADGRQRGFHPVPTHDVAWQSMDDPAARGAGLLMAAVSLLLLLACMNVASLMTARAESRHRELSIHAGLGADNLRIARRLLFEGLMLSTAGGVLGLSLTRPIIDLITQYLLQSTPVGFGDWGIGSSIFADSRVIAMFFVAVTLTVTVLTSLLPMRSVLNKDLGQNMGRTHLPSRAGGRRIGQCLVIAQTALSVILLMGATLLTRTLIHVGQQDLGFDTAHRHVAMLHVPKSSSDETGKSSYDSVLSDVRSMAGVESAALTGYVPPGYLPELAVRPVTGDGDPVASEPLTVRYNTVSNDFFNTLSLPLLLGRDFDHRDRSPSANTVIISRLAADRLWPDRSRPDRSRPDQSPIGRSLILETRDQSPPQELQVIGVVAQGHLHELSIDPQPVLYFNVHQRPPNRLAILAHAERSFLPKLGRHLKEHYPEIAIRDAQPLEEQVRRASTDPRMYSDLGNALALLGLGLAAVGIFGVASHDIGRRTREMAVRQAVGASRKSIQRLVLRETGRLLAWGLIIGWIGAALLVSLIRSLLVGIEPHDPTTVAVVTSIMILTALAAAWLPAYRASRVLPADALRNP